ncbi:MAG: hypothetical protein ACE366_00625 [Bradymonadia bacterium]
MSASTRAAPTRLGRLTIFGLMLGAIGVFGFWHFKLWHYFLDDAYITFRYAQNFAEGHGLTFNPNGAPVEGYTNFLWTLLMAPAFSWGIDITLWAKGWSIALGVISALLVGSLIPTNKPRDHWIKWSCVALSLMHPVVVLSEADGLETPLLTVSTLAVAWVLIKRPVDQVKLPRLVLAGVFATCAALSRPDGLAVAIAAVMAWSFAHKQWKRALVVLAVPVTVVVVHALWRHSVYGAWVPNTFYVKVGGRMDIMMAGAKLGGKFMVWTGAIALWAPVLWWMGHRRLKDAGERETDSRLLAVGSFLFLAVGARFAFVIYSGGAWMGTYRFLAPALPLLYALAGLALVYWLPSGPTPLWRRLIAPGLLAMSAGLALLWGMRLVPGQVKYGDRLGRSTIEVGKFLKTAGQPGDEVAVLDAGAIPFYSGMGALDLVGLNDAHLARNGARSPTPKKHYMLTLDAQADRDYIFDRNPRWMVLQTKEPAVDAVKTDKRASVRNLAADPRFEQYEHVWRFESSKTYHYHVFKRRDETGQGAL